MSLCMSYSKSLGFTFVWVLQMRALLSCSAFWDEVLEDMSRTRFRVSWDVLLKLGAN